MRDSRKPEPPPFVRAHFNPAALETDAATLIVLDRDHKIMWTNPAWSEFALSNRGGERIAHGLIGTSYFDGVSGPFVGLFRDAFHDVLSSKTPFLHDYECSSERVARRFRLRALPLGEDGLLLEHSLTASGPHEHDDERLGSHELLEEIYRDAVGVVSMCGNCRRTRRPSNESAWDWVPRFIASPVMPTSHGICPTCAAFYYDLLTD
jgi:hypothetical protein